MDKIKITKRTVIPFLLPAVIIGSIFTIWSPYGAFAATQIPSYYPGAIDTEQFPNYVLKRTIEISASYDEAQRKVPPVRVSIPETTGGGNAFLAITQATFVDPDTGQNVPHTRVGNPAWIRCQIQNIRTGAFAGSAIIEDNNQADYSPGWVDFNPARQLADRALPTGGFESYWKADDFDVWCHGPNTFQEINARLDSFTGVITVYDYFATPPGDLSVTSVSAVQAPDDPDFVVDGKPTLLKAKIKNTFTDTKTVDIAVQSDSANYAKAVTGIAIEPGEKDYYLPNNEFLIPSGTQFAANIVVDYDPNNSKGKITESNEDNNVGIIPTALPVKITKDLKILYVPLRLVGDTNTDPTCNEVDQVRIASEKYLDSIFPVNPDRTVHVLDCDFPQVDLTPWTPPLDADPNCAADESGFPKPGCKVAQLFIALQELTWGKGIDHVVAVTRDKWFYDVVQVNQGLGAISGRAWPHLSFVDSVIVEKDQLSGGMTAHEIAHTYDILHTDVGAPGYWVTERIGTEQFADGQNTRDFMDPQIGAEKSEVKHWIAKNNFNQLIDYLKKPGDPTVIGISGIISSDGAGAITTLKRFDDIQDISLNNAGEYTLLFQDSSGNSLDQTSFDIDFRISEPENTELGTAPFSLRIPDVPGTEKVVLKKGDQVLAEKTFGSSGGDTTPPDTAINSAKDSAGNAIQNETSTTSDSITFEFSSPDADVSKFQCSIDGAALEDNCTSPKTYSNLAAGQQHTFRVIAVDAAGNVDPTPAVYVWTVQAQDTTPPDTKIDSAKDGNGNTITAGGTTSSDSVTFTFSSPDSDVDKYQCNIDGSSWQDCTSPKTYSSLAQGQQHNFGVKAIDKSGNADQSPAKISWNIQQPTSVKWTIKGFYAPVDMNDVVNTLKSGLTVPLKFEVFEGVQEKTDTAVVDSFTQQKISCSSLADEDTDAIEITTTGGTDLRYDSSSGQFIQNWKTPAKSPNTCWKVTLTTDDDSSIEALFKLTK